MTRKEILSNGKIDIHHLSARYKAQEEHLMADQAVTERNKRLIRDFLRDCELGKTILEGQRKKLGTARLVKYAGMLRKLATWLGKDFDAVSQKEMESFILDLENDRVVRENGQAYLPTTKRDYKVTLRKFYKWQLGKNEIYPEIVRWIDTRETQKEIPCLRKREIERLSGLATSIRDRAMLWFLFDSGARVEEFLNIRHRNLEETRGDQGRPIYRVRIEHSKTKPRTILLPIASSHLKMYLEFLSKKSPDDPLFDFSYGNLAKTLRRLGGRALDRNVHAHLLRHSSATYYATRLSRAAFCYRFGWSYSSDMPDRYIDREALSDQESVRAVRTDTLEKLTHENTTLKEDLAHLRDQMVQVHALMSHLTKDPEVTQGLARAARRLGEGERLRRLKLNFS
jgi:integrase/recombinase XerD